MLMPSPSSKQETSSLICSFVRGVPCSSVNKAQLSFPKANSMSSLDTIPEFSVSRHRNAIRKTGLCWWMVTQMCSRRSKRISCAHRGAKADMKARRETCAESGATRYRTTWSKRSGRAAKRASSSSATLVNFSLVVKNIVELGPSSRPKLPTPVLPTPVLGGDVHCSISDSNAVLFNTFARSAFNSSRPKYPSPLTSASRNTSINES
mmetsp:Transcript_45637/g.121057  ORF Transcript_45637/g.121057 Transcript_45637/m.121057 type:complete len:207 (+) Transcript_45637:289-909(+)